MLRGFRDLLPGEMLFRETIISKIKKVYELYGFVPLGTPALEYKDILLGYGEEASKQIYLFREPEGCDVGLRFDLTVPLSRVIAQYQDLPRPFKRYQIQPAWRYDKPDPGRFREFLQFDIDTVGTESMIADAEIMSAIYESLQEVGLSSRIRISHRKILNSLLVYAGISPDLAHRVFRVLDKLEKQGLENVKLELADGRVDDSGAKISGLGLSSDKIDKICRFLDLPRGNRVESLEAITELFANVKGAQTGIDELREIDSYLTAMDKSDNEAIIDFSIARGLDYYTGPVFEAILTDERVAGFGSVMGGGRYDELIGHFTGEPVPATGASIGVDRLFAALQKLQEGDSRSSTADVLVTVMMPEKRAEYVRIANMLRSEGINTELYTGNERSIGKQLKYADRMAIPVAVIVGSDEMDAQTVSIKDLGRIIREKVEIESRKEWVKKKVGQITVPFSDMVTEIKKMLDIS